MRPDLGKKWKVYYFLQLDPTGIQVILGYADGVVRLFAIETEADASQQSAGTIYKLTKALQARYVMEILQDKNRRLHKIS